MTTTRSVFRFSNVVQRGSIYIYARLNRAGEIGEGVTGR